MTTGTGSAGLRYQDLLALPEDGKRHELLEGEHVVTPAPGTRHQRLSMRLTRVLLLYLERHAAGELFAAPIDVYLSESDVVQPDLVFLIPGHNARLGEMRIDGAPDLVVEIVSARSRRDDEVRKRGIYQRFGVSEYWIVDPEVDSVKVYRRTDQGFPRVAELTAEANETLTTPLLPGLEIPLRELFARGPG